MSELASIMAPTRIDPSLPRYESLVHVFRAAVESVPEQTAVILEDRRITYRQFGRVVSGMTRDLEAAGVEGRVIVLMPNSIEMNVAIMAVMAAGAQVAPVNPWLTPGELEKVLAGADGSMIIAAPSTADKARAMAPALGIEDIDVFGADDGRMAAWLGDAALDAPPERCPAADDLALLIFTGGSTGLPKGVDHTHRGLVWSLLQHCTVWPVEFGAERFLNVAPMFHIWGLSYATWVPIYARSLLVMVPKYEPDRVIQALGEHRITVFGGGPAPIYMGLLGSPLFEQTDLTALKHCLSGGTPCPAFLHSEWSSRTGRPLLEGWGMSEGTPLCLNPAEGERRLMSVGNPVPETQVSVVDVETGTRVLERGEHGEVRVRGPQIMRGYRNSPQETRNTLRDGWIHTGDIGYLDDDGFVFLVDRKKDMVLVGGFNVYPREVDEILFHHPAIREAATVGRPDPRLGEVLVAFVALEPEQAMTEDEFFAYCKEKMVKYKRPVEVYFVDALPRTGTNKINRVALRERLRLAPDGPGGGRA